MALNSPNDAVVRSDGSVWFSDPDFGITSDYEGFRAESEIGANNVSPDRPRQRRGAARRRRLRGAERAGVLARREQAVRLRHPVGRDPRIRRARGRHALRRQGLRRDAGRYGRFDNIRFDDGGRLWAAAMDGGVHCYDPDGTLLGRLLTPEPVANVAFGGAKNNIMFLAASTSVYCLMTAVTGGATDSPMNR